MRSDLQSRAGATALGLGLVIAASACTPPMAPPAERSPALCANGIDDDGDGFIDCADQDCLRTTVCADAGRDVGPDVDLHDGDMPDVEARDASLDARLADATAGDAAPDAAPADASRDAPVHDGARSEAGARCARACDCPSGTTCTIEGVCEGTACTARCGADGACPCGNTCTDGFCTPFVGSGTACRASCDCAEGQLCAGGHCVKPCGFERFQCFDDAVCAACGYTCDTFTARCRAATECSCNTRCPFDGAAACVGERCVAPPGRRFDPGPDELPLMVPSPSELPTPQVTFVVPAATRVRHVELLLALEQSGAPFLPRLTLYHPSGEALTVMPAGGTGGTGDCSQRGYRVVVFPLTNPLEAPGFSALEGGRDGGGIWRLRAINDLSSASTILLRNAALFIASE